MSAPAHVPIQRILERVTALPRVQPLRIFPILLPMWGVEIKTVILDAQPYEVFDQYLARAIARGGVDEPGRLAAFFGVDLALVERALGFLEAIGHVRRDGGRLEMTDLGHRSVAAGCRYVIKEDRQRLYFDGFTSSPLTSEHYAGAEWLDEPGLRLGGTQFCPVNTLSWFRAEALRDLESRADRERFNLPGSLRSVELVESGRAWLPAYVVECLSELLVFVKAIDGPDPYLADLVKPYLRGVLAAEHRVDDLEVARKWLAGRGFAEVPVRRLPNRVLRASLPAAAFGPQVRWAQLGSFETHRQAFFQLWCEDETARRRALLFRAAAIISSGRVRRREEVDQWLGDLAGQLAVPTPKWEDLRAHADSEGDEALGGRLDDLTA
jgi:hypothetical protein